MVQPSGPIDSDVGILPVEFDGGADGAAGGGLTEAVQAVENRAVLADIETLEVPRVGVVVESFGRHG